MIQATNIIKGNINAPQKIKGEINASIMRVFPELENVEITPTLEDQVVKSDMYGINEVKVKGVQSYIDEDIKPEYIVDGVDILGVVGNVVELQGEEKTVTPTTEQQIILPSEGKNAVTKLTVEAVDNTIDENIKPEYIVDGVDILGVTGNYKGIDTSDATVNPEDVLEGETIYINNEKVTGTMPNNGELEYTSSDEEQAIPTGYTSGGTVKAADITTLSEYSACLTLAKSIDNIDDYTDTTATAEDIVKGKTAYSNGERIVGELVVLDTSDATATANDILKDKTAYVNGEKVIGELEVGEYNVKLDINNVDTNKKIYTGITEINNIDLSTKTSIQQLCRDMTNLKKFSCINTDNITDMTYLFYNCKKITEIILPFNNKSTGCSGMFYYCSKLQTINLFDTSKVTSMYEMFANSGIINLPLFDTSSVMSLSRTFSSCNNLSDESLNNILQMCSNATKITSNKTLKYVGLTSAQATRCQSLSNYQACIAAGWTTGY